MPIAIGVRNAPVIVPSIEIALGADCLQSISSALMGDSRFNWPLESMRSLSS